MKTVRVYSANPKTADGYNTFIFRRDIARSLSKLAWAPVIDGSRNPIPEGVEIGGRAVRYSADDKRRLVEFVERIAHAQKGPVENDDFGHFEITKVFATEVQCHAISTRREIESVSSAAEIAKNMIHFVGSPNEEMKRKKANKYFEYGLAKIRLSDGIYLVMGEVGIQANKRPYYDQRVVAKFKVDSEVTSLHGQTRIGESTFEQVYDNRFRLILQGVGVYDDARSSAQTVGQSPMFSIIIPAYNVAPYLRECLDSVLAQGFENWECVAVDDEATDEGPRILDEYAMKDRRMHVIHQKNKGEGGARNAGIAAAKGEWIFFLDGDDIMANGALKCLARLIADHPQERMFRFAYKDFGDGESLPRVEENGSSTVIRFGQTIEMEDFFTYVWQHLYHRSIIEGILFKQYKRGCDRVFVDDVLLNRVGSLVKTDQICYLYRQRAGSAMNSVPSTQVIIDEMQHRRDLVLMIEAGRRNVDYAGSWWLEGYFIDQVGALIAQKSAGERARLWREWLKCVREMKDAKGLSRRAGRIYRICCALPCRPVWWLLARLRPLYMSRGILPRAWRKIKRCCR